MGAKRFFKDSNFSLLIAIIVIIIFMSLKSPYFFTLKNFLSIGLHASIVGIMAAGLTVSMLMGIFDLSQFPVATLSGIAMGFLVSKNVSPFIAILAAILVGFACGSFNALCLNVFKVNPIITTLATMLIFRSLCYIFTGAKNTIFSSPFFDFIGRGYVFKIIPVSLIGLIVIFIITSYILNITVFGRKVYAVGANPSASQLYGISVKKIRTAGLIISSVCSSIAGIFMMSQLGAIIPRAGVGSELEIPASVILGGLGLAGGRGKMSGTILGICIIALIGNGLILAGVESFYQDLAKGLVLLIAVVIDSIRGGGYQ